MSIDGSSVPGEPRNVIPTDASPRTIGSAVLEALEGARTGVAVAEFEREVSCTLQLAGAKSWDELERTWRFVPIEAVSENTLLIAPMKRIRPRGQMGEVGDPTYTCGHDPERIGKILRNVAFEADDSTL